MFRTIHALVLAAGLLAFGLVVHASAQDRGPGGEPGQKELEQKLQGTWQVLSLEANGKKIPEGKAKEMRLVIDGNNAYLTDSTGKKGKSPEGEEDDGYTITVDTSKKPAWITLVPKGRPEFPTTGILAFDGETLRICHSKFSNERPTEFRSDERSATILTHLKRLNASK